MFGNLHKALGQAVLEDNYISCDETCHKVITKTVNPDTQNINKEYIWAMSVMNLNLVYYFCQNGSRKDAVIHEKYEGTIQSDKYAPYKSLGDKILRLSGFQHCNSSVKDHYVSIIETYVLFPQWGSHL